MCVRQDTCVTVVHMCMHMQPFTHTHTHTHRIEIGASALRSLEPSASVIAISPPALQPLKCAAFSHMWECSRLRKMNSCSLPTQNFCQSCCNPGRSYSISSVGTVLFYSCLFRRIVSASPLDDLPTSLSLIFLGGEFSCSVSILVNAIRRIQNPGPENKRV